MGDQNILRKWQQALPECFLSPQVNPLLIEASLWPPSIQQAGFSVAFISASIPRSLDLGAGSLPAWSQT